MLASDLKARAAIRNSEHRRMLHAMETLEELLRKHFPGALGEHYTADLAAMKAHLTETIRNQHIIDPNYAAHKAIKVPEGL